MTRVLSLRWLSAAYLALASLFIPNGRTVPRPTVAPRLYAGLVWRNIGPFRAGRIASVTGAIGEPGVFYAGLPEGGVWKTTSAGVTWFPIFDSVASVAAVGAIDVAPSDPNVIYAGTGDMPTGGSINRGNGVYKSLDAGRTWRHLGLDSTSQIPSMLIDPHDPTLVLVAAQGDIHRKSDSRGVYRSTDGGSTWTRTLFIDNETGIEKLARAYDEPSVVFAATDRHYAPPGAPRRRGAAPDTGRTGTALYKSTDEGLTWHEITGDGLPRLFGRTSIAVAGNSHAQRVYLIGNFGLYRSDNGGATWRRMDPTDGRIGNGQGGYNCGVYVDPQNPDIVYTVNTSSYRSTDGGNTFTGFKGAPGGDDPQQMWIDPTNGKRIFLGMDQGATITLDGGATWSRWYNQSTEQVYHISADNSFPYWVYATQQDAGAVRSRSRGKLGEITPLDWSPVPGWEWGTIVADPLHPDTVYSSGSGIVKISYPDAQWINVSPALDPSLHLRTTNSQPMVWAPWNQHQLLAGFQYLMATTDGGVHWKAISPDLAVPTSPSRQLAGHVANADHPAPPPRSAIQTISASTVAPGTIWVGTNDGLIQVTRNGGKTWSNVSIPGLPDATRADIETVDASHQNAATAYATVDLHTLGDDAPYIYRTLDFGKTWTKIVAGLPVDEPSGSFARVVRADPEKEGLLFAGTESRMYVSFDNGDHWQSLQLNLPNTSYRDIAFHGNDLIVGTYGRGIWILDDYAVLRQLTPAIASQPAHLFKPGDAIRVRRNVGADTPYPPEVPHALNPPPGAIIYYSLSAKPAGEITLDVIDAADHVVRHLSSAPIQPVTEAAQPPEPNFWLATPQPMPTNAGTNRINWDLRYDAPPAFHHTFEINANPGLTPPSPEGPLALPGVYTLRLTVDGRHYTQTVNVRNDPRSHVPMAALRAQHALLMKLYDGLQAAWNAYHQAAALRTAVQHSAVANAPPDLAAASVALIAKLDTVAGDPEGGNRFRFRRGPPPPPNFVRASAALARELSAQDNADMAPTSSMAAEQASACSDLTSAKNALKRIATHDLSAFNAARRRYGMAAVAAPALPGPTGC